MKLTSSAFTHEGSIPAKYTCDGDDLVPPLKISDVPSNAKSLALVMDDPDAPMGTWDHWVIWNIPTDKTEITEGKEPAVPHGANSWKRNIWNGPCPPDREHRYFFKLYALDTELDLPEGSTKKDVEAAMKGHVIAEAQLMGKYKRPGM